MKLLSAKYNEQLHAKGLTEVVTQVIRRGDLPALKEILAGNKDLILQWFELAEQIAVEDYDYRFEKIINEFEYAVYTAMYSAICTIAEPREPRNQAVRQSTGNANLTLKPARIACRKARHFSFRPSNATQDDYFDEYQILGEEETGFIILGTDREKFKDALLTLRLDQISINALASEIKSRAEDDLFILPATGQQLLNQCKIERRAYQGLLTNLPEQKVDIRRDNNNLAQALRVALERKNPTQLKLLQDQQKITEIAEIALVNYCQSQEAYVHYVQAFKQDLPLGVASIELYAKTAGMTVFIWETTDDKGRLNLRSKYVAPNPVRIVHLLISGEVSDFSLLLDKNDNRQILNELNLDVSSTQGSVHELDIISFAGDSYEYLNVQPRKNLMLDLINKNLKVQSHIDQFLFAINQQRIHTQEKLNDLFDKLKNNAAIYVKEEEGANVPGDMFILRSPSGFAYKNAIKELETKIAQNKANFLGKYIYAHNITERKALLEFVKKIETSLIEKEKSLAKNDAILCRKYIIKQKQRQLIEIEELLSSQNNNANPSGDKPQQLQNNSLLQYAAPLKIDEQLQTMLFRCFLPTDIGIANSLHQATLHMENSRLSNYIEVLTDTMKKGQDDPALIALQSRLEKAIVKYMQIHYLPIETKLLNDKTLLAEAIHKSQVDIAYYLIQRGACLRGDAPNALIVNTRDIRGDILPSQMVKQAKVDYLCALYPRYVQIQTELYWYIEQVDEYEQNSLSARYLDDLRNFGSARQMLGIYEFGLIKDYNDFKIKLPNTKIITQKPWVYFGIVKINSVEHITYLVKDEDGEEVVTNGMMDGTNQYLLPIIQAIKDENFKNLLPSEKLYFLELTNNRGHTKSGNAFNNQVIDKILNGVRFITQEIARGRVFNIDETNRAIKSLRLYCMALQSWILGYFAADRMNYVAQYPLERLLAAHELLEKLPRFTSVRLFVERLIKYMREATAKYIEKQARLGEFSDCKTSATGETLTFYASEKDAMLNGYGLITSPINRFEYDVFLALANFKWRIIGADKLPAIVVRVLNYITPFVFLKSPNKDQVTRQAWQLQCIDLVDGKLIEDNNIAITSIHKLKEKIQEVIEKENISSYVLDGFLRELDRICSKAITAPTYATHVIVKRDVISETDVINRNEVRAKAEVAIASCRDAVAEKENARIEAVSQAAAQVQASKTHAEEAQTRAQEEHARAQEEHARAQEAQTREEEARARAEEERARAEEERARAEEERRKKLAIKADQRADYSYYFKEKTKQSELGKILATADAPLVHYGIFSSKRGDRLVKAVAYSLNLKTQVLCHRLADYIEAHLGELTSDQAWIDLPPGVTVANYLEGLRAGIAGENRQGLNLLMRMLSRPIVIFNKHGQIINQAQFSPYLQATQADKPIFLYQRIGVQHQVFYDALVKADKHFYTDDEMNRLLRYYLGADTRIELLTAMLGTNLATQNILQSNMLAHKAQRTQAIEHQQGVSNHVVIPVNLYQSHWVLLWLAYEPNTTQVREIDYFDPIGSPMPAQLYQALTSAALYPGAVVNTLSQPVQQDGHSCGAWVIEAARLLATQARLPDTTHDIAQARAAHWHVLYPNVALDEQAVLAALLAAQARQSGQQAESSQRNQR